MNQAGIALTSYHKKNIVPILLLYHDSIILKRLTDSAPLTSLSFYGKMGTTSQYFIIKGDSDLCSIKFLYSLKTQKALCAR